MQERFFAYCPVPSPGSSCVGGWLKRMLFQINTAFVMIEAAAIMLTTINQNFNLDIGIDYFVCMTQTPFQSADGGSSMKCVERSQNTREGSSLG